MFSSFSHTFNKGKRNSDSKVRIGAIEVEFDVTSITINGHEVADAGIEYIIAYGLRQALTDSYAQDSDEKSPYDQFKDKLSGIVEGTISAGTRGDPVLAIMKDLARKELRKQMKKGFTGLEAEEQTALVEKAVKQFDSILRPIAERMHAESKASAGLDLTALDETAESGDETADEKEESEVEPTPAPKASRRKKAA